jgi:hypothetical protein
MRHGQQLRVSLVDGTTLVGRLAWSWGWWSYRMVDVTVPTPQGDVKADGAFVVPRHAVVYVQVVGG